MPALCWPWLAACSARGIGTLLGFAEQRPPLLHRPAALFPVRAGVFAAMIEEADVVVLFFDVGCQRWNRMTELFCIVAMTAERGEAWVDRLVLYVGDNQNVQRWVETRHARNRLARHLIRLLNYSEAKHRFKVLAAPYIRTYSNEMADMIARAPKQEVADRMAKEGFQEVDLRKTWESVLAQSYERRVHAVALVDPEDWQIAMQLMSRRRKSEVPETLDLSGWCLVEIGATLPVYAQAARRLGVPVVSRPAVGGATGGRRGHQR